MKKNALFAMLKFIRSQTGLIVASTFMRVLNILAGMALFGISGFFLSRLVLQGKLPELFEWIILISIGLIKALVRYAEQISGHSAAFSILDSLRNEIFRGFTSRPAGELSGEKTGDLVTRAMSDVELIEIFFAHTIAPAITSLLFIVGSGVLSSVLLGPWWGLGISLGYALAGLGVPLIFQSLTSASAGRLRSMQAGLGADITESLSGIQDLYATGGLEVESLRHRDLAGQTYGLNQGLQLWNGFRDVLIDFILIGSLVAIVLSATLGDTSGALGLPGLTDGVQLWTLICSLAGGFSAVLGLNRAVDDLPKSQAAAERILEVLERENENMDMIDSEDAGEALLDSIEKDGLSIQVSGVSYQHPGGRGVQDISFTIDSGEHVFITGQSGSGKSTLSSLLLGLLSPQSGSILCNGVDLHSIDPARRYAIISGATQNFYLVRGTARENIELGVGVEGDPVPAHALTLVEAQRLFDELPDGEDTLLSGTDEQVSGGQRRRLILAAALARKPKLLILDEAFAGLDPGMRTRIRQNIISWAREEGVGILEFSHELTDGEGLSNILVLANGRVQENGSFRQLLDRCGLFWDLYEYRRQGESA